MQILAILDQASGPLWWPVCEYGCQQFFHLCAYMPLLPSSSLLSLL